MTGEYYKFVEDCPVCHLTVTADTARVLVWRQDGTIPPGMLVNVCAGCGALFKRKEA